MPAILPTGTKQRPDQTVPKRQLTVQVSVKLRQPIINVIDAMVVEDMQGRISEKLRITNVSAWHNNQLWHREDIHHFKRGAVACRADSPLNSWWGPIRPILNKIRGRHIDRLRPEQGNIRIGSLIECLTDGAMTECTK
tara:strand:+ start:133 stop:546 length:414 start_codon:yes stop_codon:yes gene_type:complete